MFDPQQLAALAAIVRTGSFDAASHTLGITASAVSQRIRALEERAGTVLIVRGQPCRPTPTGLRLFRHAEDVARLDAALAADLRRTEGAVTVLRIAVNADSLATWFLPALAATPGPRFEVILDDQDHAAELLRRGEVAAALTAQDTQVQGCDAWPLGALRYLATASPGFVARWFPDGVTADALEDAPALIYDEKDALQHRWAARVAGRRTFLSGHRLPSSTAFVEAARLGLGWGMNPEPLVRADLESGLLVELVPGHGLDTPLTWQASRIGRAALAPLSRNVRRVAAAALVASEAMQPPGSYVP